MKDQCAECGIAAEREDGSRWCEKYQIAVCAPGKKNPLDCYYFAEIEDDGDQPLSSRQYLALKENELASRRMRGPV
ncbi:MAG TPA: hypothetical protein VN611_10340 [Patescibacteria group bacterium]|nr:hypothetical protein [Patescibacteria group bacterium]